MRHAARIDNNQHDIVAALRAVGCSVQSLAAVGQGVPDLLVFAPRRGLLGSLVLIEVKDGAKPPSARRRTDAQLIWHADWKGPVYLVNSVDEALAIVDAIKP